MKSKSKLRKMRIDIRMGATVESLSEKYNISKAAARNYRTNYLKTLEKQKEMGMYA